MAGEQSAQVARGQGRARREVKGKGRVKSREREARQTGPRGAEEGGLAGQGEQGTLGGLWGREALLAPR